MEPFASFPRDFTRPLISLAALLLTAAISPAAIGVERYVVVVLDDSGSMDERMRRQRSINKMDAAKQALLQVLAELPSDSEVGVVLLNGQFRGSPWVVPLGAIDIPRTESAMRPVRAEGGTPLGQFMKVGADALLEVRRRKHYGSYRLLVVTDGEATDSNLVERYLPDILARGITVDVIGVDMASDHSLATKVHTYRRADDPASLRQAVREVFAETSADAADAGAAEFEMLAALPDEVAVAALNALSANADDPIGIEAAEGDDSRTPAGANRNRGPASSSRSRLNFLPVILFVFIVLVIISVLRAAVRSRPR